MGKPRHLSIAVFVVATLAASQLSAQSDDIRVRLGRTTCAADAGASTEHGYAHCLQQQRFSVRFTTIYYPESATAHDGKRAGDLGRWWHTDSAIAFWLFSPDNVEALVKVLDGRGVNGHWWLDIAVMSDQLTRTAVYPNDSTPTDPGVADGWWIETGTGKDLFGVDFFDDVLWHCAYPFDYIAWQTYRFSKRRACAIQGQGTTLSLRDAWNPDGSIPEKYYR